MTIAADGLDHTQHRTRRPAHPRALDGHPDPGIPADSPAAERRGQDPMTFLDYAIVIGFLVVMAFAGLAISKLIKDSDDFFVAGRELTPFILCATITATNLSMIHFVGMGGTAYQSGVSVIWQNWTGDMALVLSGIFVLPLLRRLRI